MPLPVHSGSVGHRGNMHSSTPPLFRIFHFSVEYTSDCRSQLRALPHTLASVVASVVPRVPRGAGRREPLPDKVIFKPPHPPCPPRGRHDRWNHRNSITSTRGRKGNGGRTRSHPPASPCCATATPATSQPRRIHTHTQRRLTVRKHRQDSA